MNQNDFTLRRRTVLLAPATVMSLIASPATVVPAPGLGKWILPEFAVFRRPAVSTPWTWAAAILQFRIGDTTVGTPSGLATPLGDTPEVVVYQAMTNIVSTSTIVAYSGFSTDFENLPLKFGNYKALPEISNVTGNGLVVQTYYRLLCRRPMGSTVGQDEAERLP
jgi:hypothetical protein